MYSLLVVGFFTTLGLGPSPARGGAIEKRASYDYEIQDKSLKETPAHMFDDSAKLIGSPPGSGSLSTELLHGGSSELDSVDYAMDKRAPMGFHGMRGKKKTSGGGLMGFVGTRGKKFDMSDLSDFQLQLLDEGAGGLPPYLAGEKRGPSSAFFGVRGKKVPSGSNFFGVRGKKAPSSANFFGVRGKKAPSGFIGMRGKKYSDDDRLEELIDALKDYSLANSREKRATNQHAPLSFQG